MSFVPGAYALGGGTGIGLEWLEKLIGKKGNRYVNTEKSISVPYWSCVNNHVTQMAAVRCGISPSTKLALI